MTAKMVPFATREIGYDPDQVDKYFQRVAAEYSNLQRSYTELYQKYDDLVKRASKIINEAHRDREAVQKAKALLNSEIDSIVSRLQSIAV